MKNKKKHLPLSYLLSLEFLARNQLSEQKTRGSEIKLEVFVYQN